MGAPNIKYSWMNKVAFEPVTHTYTVVDTGQRLTSVTTFLKQFKEPFDADTISKFKAEKEGTTPERIRSNWSMSGTMGTYIHQIFEDYTNGLAVQDQGIFIKEKVAHAFINDMFRSGRLTPAVAEDIVYNLDLGIAGQIDHQATNKEGDVILLDFKTNKSIPSTSYGGPKMLKAPFEVFEDCTLNHYKLQLCFYKFMYWQQYGILPKACYIVHIDTTGYEMIKADTKDIDMAVYYNFFKQGATTNPIKITN